MMRRDGSPRATSGSAAVRPHVLAQAVWNLRLLGLFLVGPVVGVALVGGIFGLPPGLYGIAAVVFLFTLCLFALVVRGEWRRLAVEAGR